jgi:hypothetical protein
MARTDNFRGVERHCVMCAALIPAERKSDAITCSPECTKKRRDFLRSKLDQTQCRYCNKPSSPEDRVLFGMWRKWMRKGDESAQVVEVDRLLRENERLKRKLASLDKPVEEPWEAKA